VSEDLDDLISQSACILVEIAELKKIICHCGKHARAWCSAAQTGRKEAGMLCAFVVYW